MAIDKPLTTPYTPMLEEEPLPMEISIMDSGPMLTEDGGMILQFGEMTMEPATVAHGDNLADYIDETDLMALAGELVQAYEADLDSRSDWEKSYIKGLDLLGLKFEDRTIPWDGACGVFHPMLSEAVVRFQAQSIQEIHPADGPVRVEIVGKSDIEVMKQGKRVQEYMNYVITDEMPEYRAELERLLFSLPIAGSAFKKCYFDPDYGRPCSMFVPAEDFVVAYGTTDLTSCERATHRMKRTKNQVRKQQVAGFYRDIELPDPQPDIDDIRRKYDDLTGEEETMDFDDRHTLLEMHVHMDLEGFEDTNEYGEPTGIALPYVVTIDKTSRTVLAIRRNWLEGDPYKEKREYYVHYQYLPGLGFYGFGLVHMIGGLSKSATSLIRQLIDAGTLANLPGGLKTRGLRIKGDDSPIMPGEFRDVDVPAGAIRDNIQFLPHKEPSGVLYQLLGDIVNEGRRFASAADVKAADMNAEAPVGTTLAILEREMKVMSAVQARLHAAVGKELRILAEIIKDYGPTEYPYAVEGQHTIAEDFDDRIDILPVSDPNAGTMAQRIMQYQAALQLAAQAPQMYDLPLLHRQMLDVLGINQAEKIVPIENDMKPMDPVTENMAIINGEPTRAFAYQDHEAHIQTHMAMQQNPDIQSKMQKHPNGQAVQAAMASHIAEHVAFAYRDKIEQELGVRLPDPEETLPQDIEYRLSQLVAPAAAQLTGKAQKMAEAEENARKSKDPVLELQKEELAIKKQQVEQQGRIAEAKEQREAMVAQSKQQSQEQSDMVDVQKAIADRELDLQKHRDKLQLEYAKLEQQRDTEIARLAAGDTTRRGKERLDEFKVRSNAQLEGFRRAMEFIDSAMESQTSLKLEKLKGSNRNNSGT